MKKTLLVSLGLATSLLAITQEQQEELDKVFEEYKTEIQKNNSIPASKKEAIIKQLAEKKKEIESQSDEEVSSYLDKNSEEMEMEAEECSPKSSDGWLGWAFGAFGARGSFFLGGNLGGAYMFYGSIGPRYNFTNEGSSLNLKSEGFSLSLPIGFGAINTGNVKNNVNFVLPIALEANYRFSSYWGFGLNAGLRYTYSPQDMGDLHIMDIYAGLDLVFGAYVEAGYVFYSSQDVKVGNRTISTDPLSGAITLNMGFRF